MGKPINDPNRITIAEAARSLGMSEDTFRQCMIKNAFPFPVGTVILKNGGKHRTYVVYRKPIEKLMQFWGLTD